MPPGRIAAESVLRKSYKFPHRPRDVATSPWQARIVDAQAEQREPATFGAPQGLPRRGSAERVQSHPADAPYGASASGATDGDDFLFRLGKLPCACYSQPCAALLAMAA